MTGFKIPEENIGNDKVYENLGKAHDIYAVWDFFIAENTLWAKLPSLEKKNTPFYWKCTTITFFRGNYIEGVIYIEGSISSIQSRKNGGG